MTLKWLGMCTNPKYHERDSERNVTDLLTSCESAQDKKKLLIILQAFHTSVREWTLPQAVCDGSAVSVHSRGFLTWAEFSHTLSPLDLRITGYYCADHSGRAV
jgi:hypothetical protein